MTEGHHCDCPVMCVCVCVCACVRAFARAKMRLKANSTQFMHVYRVSKTHRMPYLYRSFSAKEPFN